MVSNVPRPWRSCPFKPGAGWLGRAAGPGPAPCPPPGGTGVGWAVGPGWAGVGGGAPSAVLCLTAAAEVLIPVK